MIYFDDFGQKKTTQSQREALENVIAVRSMHLPDKFRLIYYYYDCSCCCCDRGICLLSGVLESDRSAKQLEFHLSVYTESRIESATDFFPIRVVGPK